MSEPDPLIDRRLGPHTVALLGAGNGKYPDANALLVTGGERTVLIEPTLGVRVRALAGALPPVDLVILSHVHEDHVPALPLLPDAECWVHRDDRFALESLDALLDLFGTEPARRASFGAEIVERFFFEPRPDALSYDDGASWDLGGGVRIRARHSPGHTAGHCFLEIEPDGVVYLGDVDLSSFGPYYGDAVSSLEQFERTLELAEELDARFYVSGHHKGVIEERAVYLDLLGRYRAKLAERDRRLLEFLVEPRTLDEIVAHRFIYRPGDQVSGADKVERISMTQHLRRLQDQGLVERRPGERFAAR